MGNVVRLPQMPQPIVVSEGRSRNCAKPEKPESLVSVSLVRGTVTAKGSRTRHAASSLVQRAGISSGLLDSLAGVQRLDHTTRHRGSIVYAVPKRWR